MVVGVTSQFPWPPHLCPGLWHCLLPSLLFCFRGFRVWVDGGSIFPDSQAANLGRPLGLHCHSLHLTCQFLSSKYISTLPTSRLPPPPLLCPSGPVPVPCPLLSPLPSYAGSNARARVTLIQNGGRTQLVISVLRNTIWLPIWPRIEAQVLEVLWGSAFLLAAPHSLVPPALATLVPCSSLKPLSTYFLKSLPWLTICPFFRWLPQLTTSKSANMCHLVD